MPAEITVFEDRSFTFVTKAPLAAALLKRAAGVESGSAEPNRTKVGKVSQRPAARDRRDEDGRPERQRRRARHEDRGGHRPQHGHRGDATDGRHGKKYLEAAKLIEADRRYLIGEACELLPRVSPTKFDATVELHLRLGIDPRHADQLVRGHRRPAARHRPHAPG